jgi:hypothetical protein
MVGQHDRDDNQLGVRQRLVDAEVLAEEHWHRSVGLIEKVRLVAKRLVKVWPSSAICCAICASSAPDSVFPSSL